MKSNLDSFLLAVGVSIFFVALIAFAVTKNHMFLIFLLSQLFAFFVFSIAYSITATRTNRELIEILKGRTSRVEKAFSGFESGVPTKVS